MTPQEIIESMQVNAVEFYVTLLTSAMMGLVGLSLAISRIDEKTKPECDKDRF